MALNDLYNIFYRAATKSVVVSLSINPAPELHVKIGEASHGAGSDNIGGPESHVMYHHVQDALYAQGATDIHNHTITIIPRPIIQ